MESIDVTIQLKDYAKKEDIGVKVVWITKSAHKALVDSGKVEPETAYLVTED